MIGFDLLVVQPLNSNMRGIGQSLIAASAVAMVGFATALAQYLWVTRPYDFILSLGIQRFRRRGSPGSGWPKQLRAVKSKLVFFGKDHNKLMAVHADLIKRLLLEDVAVTFYLLSHDDDYYTRNATELKERIAAAKALFQLRKEVADISADAARRLHLHQYRDVPTFSCTLLDQTIIFGPYLHGLKNPETPEFEIEPGDDTWFYDACKSAFEAAVVHDKVSELAQPPMEPA